MYYKLIGKLVVPCTMREWSEAFERTRRVAETQCGVLWISTVFLGLDHGFGGPPKLFETMIFEDSGSGEEIYMARCFTYEEAEAMHKAAVTFATDLIIDSDAKLQLTTRLNQLLEQIREQRVTSSGPS